LKNQQGKKAENNILDFYRDHEFLFKVALKHALKKNFDSALKYVDKAIQFDVHNADYLFNKACILVEKREIEESIDILNRIIWQIDPTYTECYFGLGCNYYESGDYAKAFMCFEKYISAAEDGDFIEDAYDILLFMQFSCENGDIQIDKSLMNKIKNPNSYRKHSFKLDEEGSRLLYSGKYVEAIKKLEKSIQNYPEITSARVRLSMAYYMTGNAELAKCLADSVLKIQKSNYLARLCLAFYYSEDGQTDMSEQMLKWLEKVRGKRYNSVRGEAQMLYEILITKATVGENFIKRISGAVQGLSREYRDREGTVTK
jgi:tetratricopeptide (TPR) repeat protein